VRVQLAGSGRAVGVRSLVNRLPCRDSPVTKSTVGLRLVRTRRGVHNGRGGRVVIVRRSVRRERSVVGRRDTGPSTGGRKPGSGWQAQRGWFGGNGTVGGLCSQGLGGCGRALPARIDRSLGLRIDMSSLYFRRGSREVADQRRVLRYCGGSRWGPREDRDDRVSKLKRYSWRGS
jgi:hypothetical protein